MTYEKWLAQVPASLKNDPIWKFEAYPKGLLLFDLVWEDSEQLMRDLRGREIARQLIRSAGSITANIDEGFGSHFSFLISNLRGANMTRMINVGLIGAGRIGRVHADHLAHRIPQANVVAVADVIEEAAQRAAADFGIPNAFQDHRAIIDNDEIQAVIICSSTDTHAQMIEEAAEAGKHIFCEKPIALDLPTIDRALEAVSRAGVKLQVGFNRRFDPSFRRVRELVASGQIGEPHILRITSRDPAPPPIEYVKVSGGIFLDMTIHDFDMARFLMGSEVEEIYAAGAVLLDLEIGQVGDIDTAIITLRFANGALGAIDNSRKAVYGYDQRAEVFGSGGVAVVSNKTPDNAVLSDAGGVHSALPLYFFVERYTEAYVEEMREFVRCILEDKAPPVTGIDGRIPVVMGYAARKSYAENRPVRLSEIDA